MVRFSITESFTEKDDRLIIVLLLRSLQFPLAAPLVLTPSILYFFNNWQRPFYTLKYCFLLKEGSIKLWDLCDRIWQCQGLLFLIQFERAWQTYQHKLSPSLCLSHSLSHSLSVSHIHKSHPGETGGLLTAYYFHFKDLYPSQQWGHTNICQLEEREWEWSWNVQSKLLSSFRST